jgi:hypothetical protein
VNLEMAEPIFEVFISGVTISADAWKRALEAPTKELPELTDEQKEAARRFKIGDEEYARGVLAGIYGEAAQRHRGEKLGSVVSRLLAGLGPDYRLEAVLREGGKFRWLLRIQTPDGLRNVQLPLDLADDVIDSELREVVDELKQKILFGLGRRELAGGQ